MIITKFAYNKLKILIPKTPPEHGGILGSKNDEVITEIVMDKRVYSSNYNCKYSPNIDFLNLCIEKWCENNISFKGIFHTHFAGVKTLSLTDIQYISDIMNSMPEEIEYLYFPIFVMPDCELVCYKAERINEKIEIELDSVDIISL
ncbi:MAG: hypothetical protein IJC74_06520 [Clostridia bacterium]|nr:hypothetical protein [Clostridia bacterium]